VAGAGGGERRVVSVNVVFRFFLLRDEIGAAFVVGSIK
jgi:hypothetical protein